MNHSSDLLSAFFKFDIFSSAEAHLCDTIARLQPSTEPLALLALATASRGARVGHSCIDLAEVSSLGASLVQTRSAGAVLPELPWPDPKDWSTALAASPIVASPADAEVEPLRPLVFDGQRIYLQRYWVHELRVAHQLLSRSNTHKPNTNVEPVLDLLFRQPESTASVDDQPQRRAAAHALKGGLSIITGGPGTGKTFTIARILAGAHMLAVDEGRSPTIALAAPTGKAAARITESIGAAITDLADSLPASRSLPVALHTTQGSATTIHQLLGWAPGDQFRHNRGNPLPHDMVIIDESSMVSLSLMSRLLEAVRPDATLVLVGDPDQLSSVDVGTVLSDIIRPQRLSPAITVLDRVHRFESGSSIAQLAESVRSGDVETAISLLTDTNRDADAGVVEWVSPHDPQATSRVADRVVEAAAASSDAAIRGDAETALASALSVKVLAATRMHQFGLHHWSDLIERTVAQRLHIDTSRRWFVGRPVIITANDRINRVANGDTGVVVSREGAMRVALAGVDGLRYLAPSRLAEVESWWAMTIHKSQGSEFDHVVVSLPPAGSPVLTRELLYTGITRARHRVTILADEESLRDAIGRPVAKASGLRSRLWSPTRQ